MLTYTITLQSFLQRDDTAEKELNAHIFSLDCQIKNITKTSKESED